MHEKFATHERPAVTVSCFMRADDGRIGEARIAVGSVSARPRRITEAENLLVDVPVESGADQARVAGEIAAEAVAPFADLNGSVEYKRNLVRVFVGKCCTAAMERLSQE